MLTHHSRAQTASTRPKAVAIAGSKSFLMAFALVAITLAACTTESGSSGGTFATVESGVQFTANGTTYTYAAPDAQVQLQLGNSITKDLAVYWRGGNLEQGFLFLVPNATGAYNCGAPRGTNGNLFASMQVQFGLSPVYRAGYLNGVSTAGWNNPQEGKSNCSVTITTIGEAYRGTLAGVFSGKLYTTTGDSVVLTEGSFRIEQ
jgi:hypothetical protein